MKSKKCKDCHWISEAIHFAPMCYILEISIKKNNKACERFREKG